MEKRTGVNPAGRILLVKKTFALFSVLICLLLHLLCVSSALAAEIFREVVPLERNHVPLHLERYIEKDGGRKSL